MKQNTCLIASRWIKTAACGLALAGLVQTVAAQSNNATNSFDTADSTKSFVQWWGGGGANATMTWDDTKDAANDPASGSVHYDANFVGAAGEQFMTFFTIANRWGWDGGYILDATTYSNLSFDINVDPSSGQRKASNDYGWLEIGLVTDGWGTTYLPARGIPLGAKGTWTHLDYPLNPTLANIDKVVGFFIKMWSNGDHTNSLIFNVDNFMITKPTAPVVIPPPTLALKAPTPGLAFVAASAGQYDRQNIRSVNSNYTWLGASGPVSYSINVAKHSDVAGLQLHMYLVPGGSDPGRPDSDWHETNILMWRINKQNDGTAWSELNYKTNAPDSNGDMYGTGSLGGGVGNPTPEGVWTLTFNQNTNVTITAPNGGTFATNISPDVISIFNATPYMQVNVGVVPNSLDRLGQMAVLKGVKITGASGGANVDSQFVGQPLDANVWGIAASSANYGVQEIGNDAAYWLTWTLPAAGFSLQTSDKVAGGTWSSPTLAGFAVGGKYRALLKQADLPSSNIGFFNMIKRPFSKLQILLPGETAAPGTPTGKTGTPDAQQATVPFNVIVNAVDETWHVVSNVNDTVSITSSDTFASLPADAQLVGGTHTFSVTLGDAQTPPVSHTITATDVTDPTKTAATSGPVQVNF